MPAILKINAHGPQNNKLRARKQVAIIARPSQNVPSSGDSPTALAIERMQKMAHTGNEQRNPALVFRLLAAWNLARATIAAWPSSWRSSVSHSLHSLTVRL